jgi:hypothetical protein
MPTKVAIHDLTVPHVRKSWMATSVDIDGNERTFRHPIRALLGVALIGMRVIKPAGCSEREQFVRRPT